MNVFTLNVQVMVWMELCFPLISALPLRGGSFPFLFSLSFFLFFFFPPIIIITNYIMLNDVYCNNQGYKRQTDKSMTLCFAGGRFEKIGFWGEGMVRFVISSGLVVIADGNSERRGLC